MKQELKQMLIDDMKCIKTLIKRNFDIKKSRVVDLRMDDGRELLTSRQQKLIESNNVVIATTKNRIEILKHKLTTT